MLSVAAASGATTGATTSAEVPRWLTQPMALVDAIRIALAQNGDILKSQHDLEAAHGIAIQSRAIVLPKLRGAAGYEHTEAVEKDPFTATGLRPPKDEWSGSVRIVQSIYEGGRMTAAWRAARLVQEQAYQEYQTVIAGTLLDVRTAYYDVLLAEQNIAVQDASVKLLEQELTNTQRRLTAGAVPRFNVLRAEVKVANARPRLIRAKNAYRTAKNALATVLGYNLPASIGEDIPMTLTSKLDPEPFDLDLSAALAQARVRRPELGALRTEVSLQKEKVIMAKSGYKPSVGVFGGYGAHNSEFTDDFYRDVAGPMAGVTMSWDIFDGLSTRGKVIEARARESRAGVNLDDTTRRVEQQVRTSYSSFIEAREVLASQLKVVEQADETVRLADSRYDAGSGTQLDVLDAQTSLTEARTTQIEAARNYLVARARLERAIGLDVTPQQTTAPTKVEIWKPTP
jgi:outer membrane protein TolC